MKIKQNKFKFRRLIETHILKSKLHEQVNLNNNLLETNLSQIVFKFKKVLNLIFKYHQYNKSILFLGTPFFLNQSFKNTNHTGIDSKFPERKLKLSLLAQKSKSVLNGSKVSFPLMKKTPNLVVAFHDDKDSKYDAIIKESVDNKIPVIKFSKPTFQNNSNDNNSPFLILNITNYSFYKNNFNTFFSLINAMLKKKTKRVMKTNDSKYYKTKRVMKTNDSKYYKKKKAR